MSHKQIHPKGWKPAKGYANAILSEGLTLNIAGQIGWNENQEFIAKDFIGQMEQTLKNIIAIVKEAGGQIEDLTRLTWYVTDKAEYLANQKKVGEILSKAAPHANHGSDDVYAVSYTHLTLPTNREV